jgi:hypothetical protein
MKLFQKSFLNANYAISTNYIEFLFSKFWDEFSDLCKFAFIRVICVQLSFDISLLIYILMFFIAIR